MSRTFNMVGGAGGGIKLASIAITHGPNKDHATGRGRPLTRRA